MSEAGQDLNDRSPRRKDNRGGFFMTAAAEDFDQNSPSPRAH